MDDKVEVARLRGRCLMIQDKIIAIQQECEEICLQSDAPDYRALYFKLFARTEEVRKPLELRYHQKRKPAIIADSRQDSLVIRGSDYCSSFIFAKHSLQ